MSTTGKEYKLAIRIAGIIDKSFSTSLATANRSLKTTVASINTDFTKLDKGFDKIMNASKKCFNAMATAAGVAGAAITAATGAAIAVGSEFESAFAGVKKTIEATDEEYEKLRQDILEMSKTIPASQEAIAGVMEIAGQLGISKESLTDFTETMINMGVATNLSAEEAATALARFSNIVSMDAYGADGISNYERLGSVVVDLGNKFATTEQEIVHIAESLAAAGNLAGMSKSSIMGISAAMSSVGLTADSGASSMSRLIMQMQQAVAEGVEELGLYAQYSGMTASEFAELFRGDASQALIQFIGGLTEAGEGSYEILEDLDLSTIRLRKSFLSLAGADDLLGNAVEIANEAWEENTALATEAGKRYETTESQIQLMKNAFKELGIVAYDDLREPFVGVIHDVTDSVHGFTEYVGGPNGISKWLDNIGNELPTLQRKFKKYGEPVFEGITGAGKWLAKNGKTVISVFTGIGAALAAYKTASTLTHIVTALTSMNPVTLGILGTAAVIGGIVTAVAAYKQHEAELVNSNLADHFGNISLSMEELQAIAEHIVSSESLGGVKEALEAFKDLDVISSTMGNAVEELDKMNWKVSIGMELTEDEQEQYKTAIDEYVKAAQEYALQSQYAVSLNLSIGLGDSAEGASIASKVDAFYNASYDEMVYLGEILSQAVNDAFADGVLDPEEIENIANLQAKMAEVQKNLATGEFDAQLSMLKMEHAGGGNLTSESFQNLQSELNAYVASASEAYKESYVKNYASLSASHDGYVNAMNELDAQGLTGAEYESIRAEIESKYLNDDEFMSGVKLLEEEYLKNVGGAQTKALGFMLDTIMQQYGDEFAAFQEVFDGTLEEYLGGDYANWEMMPVPLMDALVQEIYSSDAVDDTTKKAIEKLMEGLQPSVEQMEELKQQYAAWGIDITDEMVDTIGKIDLVGAITSRSALWGTKGDTESLYNLIGSTIVNNEEYAEVEEILKSNGWDLVGSFTDGIKESALAGVPEAMDSLYSETQKALDEIGSFDFKVNLKPAEVTTHLDLEGMSFNSGGPVYDPFGIIGHRATGGLATSPELTWFAENGPEMAIPIDGSRNAISLWEKTGRLLGMSSAFDGLDLGGGGGHAIEYSPTLQFYGDAPSKSDLEDALRVSQDEFESLMERYFKTHGRVSFG